MHIVGDEYRFPDEFAKEKRRINVMDTANMQECVEMIRQAAQDEVKEKFFESKIAGFSLLISIIVVGVFLKTHYREVQAEIAINYFPALMWILYVLMMLVVCVFIAGGALLF